MIFLKYQIKVNIRFRAIYVGLKKNIWRVISRFCETVPLERYWYCTCLNDLSWKGSREYESAKELTSGAVRYSGDQRIRARHTEQHSSKNASGKWRWGPVALLTWYRLPTGKSQRDQRPRHHFIRWAAPHRYSLLKSGEPMKMRRHDVGFGTLCFPVLLFFLINVAEQGVKPHTCAFVKVHSDTPNTQPWKWPSGCICHGSYAVCSDCPPCVGLMTSKPNWQQFSTEMKAVREPDFIPEQNLGLTIADIISKHAAPPSQHELP